VIPLNEATPKEIFPKTDTSNLPAMLKVRQVAEYLGIDRREAYEIIRKQGIPTIKLSERRTRVPRDLFLAWVKSRAESSN
jgi:excisionase family DNA binding protein